MPNIFFPEREVKGFMFPQFAFSEGRACVVYFKTCGVRGFTEKPKANTDIKLSLNKLLFSLDLLRINKKFKQKVKTVRYIITELTTNKPTSWPESDRKYLRFPC